MPACWGGILARSPCDHVKKDKKEGAPCGGENYCKKHRDELLIPEEYVQEATDEEAGTKEAREKGSSLHWKKSKEDGAPPSGPWLAATMPDGSKIVGRVFNKHEGHDGPAIFVRKDDAEELTAVAIPSPVTDEPIAAAVPTPSVSATAITSTQTLKDKRPGWFKDGYLVLKFDHSKRNFVPNSSKGDRAGTSKDNGDGGAASVEGSMRRSERKRRLDAPDDRSSDTTSLVSSGRQQQPSLSATFTVRDEDLLGLLARCLRIGDHVPLEGKVQDKGDLRRLLGKDANALGLSTEKDAEKLQDWQDKTRAQLPAKADPSTEFAAAVQMLLHIYLCDAPDDKSVDTSGLSVRWNGIRFTIRLDDERRPLPSAQAERDALRGRFESALKALQPKLGSELEVTLVAADSILVHCLCRASEIPAAILELAGGTLCGYPVISFRDGATSPRVDGYELEVRAPLEALKALELARVLRGESGESGESSGRSGDSEAASEASAEKDEVRHEPARLRMLEAHPSSSCATL